MGATTWAVLLGLAGALCTAACCDDDATPAPGPDGGTGGGAAGGGGAGAGGGGVGAGQACEGPLTIIPCAQGFGMQTVAGSGRHLDPPTTSVLRVTNLDDSGPGSLREALAVESPRTVIFEVSGTIELESNLGIAAPYATVAGQTAPSPGITLKGWQFSVGASAHDVLIQHLRFRVGDEPDGPDYNERDCMKQGGDNVVIDHCSFSWSVDELVDTRASDQTYRHCLFGEALHSPLHPETLHSRGLFVASAAERVSVIGNLFAHNAARNPVFSSVAAVAVNNVVYNYLGSGLRVTARADGPAQVSMIGNHVIRGQDSNPAPYSINILCNQPSSRIYLADTIMGEASYATPDEHWAFITHQTDVSDDTPVAAEVRANEPPLEVPRLWPRPSSEVLDWVLATAGARPADRDEVDQRIVDDVQGGTGQIIASQQDVGGWPALAENHRELSLPDDPDGDSDDDGYTNLEEWLHEQAAALEAP